ncbi:unnamed protein product [Danaus chrysippus]|uniref:(African queen) hypothetical protein n=1 Tax=Danaus chrysippus TaxID=151541 RepID=A0A8J2QHL9_9NEOP|nr:unnamed protein product [Danaus chrysippus]
MPASSINLYHMQDAKNNFNTMQLAPVCADADVLMGQCQNYHVSTNCYYGFHGQKSVENMQENYDCEMTEVDSKATNATTASRQNNSRKRSAEDSEYPQTKRLREEVQTKKCRKPETIEIEKTEKSSEDLMENLYWNLHGGSYFHLLQCL